MRYAAIAWNGVSWFKVTRKTAEMLIARGHLVVFLTGRNASGERIVR